MQRSSTLVVVPSLLALAVPLAPAAAAQIQGLAVEGGGGFVAGGQVAWVGDVDGDGLDDFATSDRRYDAGALSDVGQVRVHSGSTGQLLGQVTGGHAGAFLGWHIAGVGDVDGDGLPELAATQVDYPQPARVLLLSTASFASVRDIVLGTTSADVVLAGAGDVDGDGTPDLAVGSRYQPAGGGTVWVHSGATGALLRTLAPQHDSFGTSLTNAGDLDGDGVPELIVGAPYANLALHFYKGGLFVYRGSDGTLLRQHQGGMSDGTWTLEELGRFAVSLPDVDGDGVRDYAGQGGYPGSQVLLFSGATGALLHHYPTLGAIDIGLGIADAGDADGDGVADLLLQTGGELGTAEFLLRSGAAPWGLLDRFWVPYRLDGFAGGVDASGDGRTDLLLAESGYLDFVNLIAQPAQHHVGRVSLLGMHDLGAEVRRTCATTPNSTGEPARIWAEGSVSIADDACELVAWNLPPSQPGIVFFGFAGAQTPFGNGLLCVAPPTIRLAPGASGANGVLSSALQLGPSSPYAGSLQPGVAAYFQCWFRDPAGGGAATDLSDAVRVTLVQ